MRNEHDRALYKQRNRIERMLGHLKINRAIATRYGQLANSFLGLGLISRQRPPGLTSSGPSDDQANRRQMSRLVLMILR